MRCTVVMQRNHNQNLKASNMPAKWMLLHGMYSSVVAGGVSVQCAAPGIYCCYMRASGAVLSARSGVSVLWLGA